MALRAAQEIRRQHGPRLTRDECLRLASLFWAELVPRRRAGRRPKPQVTAACLDFNAGMRGVTLYRKHIPGWERHNRYRRLTEEKRLMDRDQEPTKEGTRRTGAPLECRYRVNTSAHPSGFPDRRIFGAWRINEATMWINAAPLLTGLPHCRRRFKEISDIIVERGEGRNESSACRPWPDPVIDHDGRGFDWNTIPQPPLPADQLELVTGDAQPFRTRSSASPQ